MGFAVVDEALDLLGPVEGSSASSSAPQPPIVEHAPAEHSDAMQPAVEPSQHVDVPGPFEAPVAPDEPADSGDVVIGPDEVVLDGTRIDSTSLKVLRTACRSLGISRHGSRAQLFKRLVYYLKHQEMLAAHSVKHNLSKELQRPVNQPGIPDQPTEQEVQEHNTTHIPFKPWCELCIAHKGRQDKHHLESHSASTFSVVSFDFGYADRGTDDSLTVLFMHDRSTKMMHAVPTPAKGGRSLPYLTQELCRFISWLGHQEVCLRTDNEPSAVSLLESCRKALKGLGVHTTVELVVPGNKEGNGAAEVTVQVIRNQANLLVEQVERSLGVTDKLLFTAHHPLYAWAVIHASWLHCRFAVSNGETPYERCTGKEYHGKICLFAETCMGYLKPSAKGLPSWQRGVWLGKTQNNDAHIISCNGALFITRSVQRIPTPWVPTEVPNVEMSPWDCAFATLGSKLMVPKRVLKPSPQPALALPPGSAQPGASNLSPFRDEEAEAVMNIPPTPIEVDEADKQALPAHSAHMGASPGVPMSAQAGLEHTVGPMMPPPPMAATSGLAIPTDVFDAAPVTPADGDEPASKKARICMVAGVEYEHEDDHNFTAFSHDELDSLEEFEFGLSAGDDATDIPTEDAMLQKLTFPYTEHEPQLSPEQVGELDTIAMEVETLRLKRMCSSATRDS